ncbi:MAG: BatA domain-containing protein [Telluria sp.]
MTSIWWLALPVLLLPIWWHRQKRERVKAVPLATARFLPRTDPQQQRVWQWVDRILLLVRCLLLAAVIAWLADPVLPWRGSSVLVAAGTDAAWAQQQIASAGYAQARRIDVAGDPLAWLRTHESQFQDDARLLVLGAVPMTASQPQFRHRVELRTKAAPFPKSEHRVAIVSERPAQWRTMFAALGGPQRYIIGDSTAGKPELIIWDVPAPPPAGLRAPLWWVGDATAFPELAGAKAVGGLRYVDSPRGRLWASDAWPPKDAAAARKLFEDWQQLHYPPVPYIAPSMALAANAAAPVQAGSGALRDFLAIALIALFALERILTHARRT